jgi:Peptidase inhibitor I78 family
MGEAGVKHLLGLALAAALLACAPGPTEVVGGPVAHVDLGEGVTPPQTPEDSCGIEAHKRLVGVAEGDIDRAALPAGARVICATCMVTQDYAPSRLNLHLSAEGRVSSLRCG